MFRFIKIAALSMLTLSPSLYASSEPKYEFNLSFQKDLPAVVGADNMTSFYRLFNFSENAVGKEIDIESQTLSKVARAARVLLLDYPMASYTMVAQHEYFGHGGRLRDIGIKDISYDINIASGATYFSAAEYALQPNSKKAAVSAAGMESTTLMASKIHDSWFDSGYINSSDAVLGAVLSYDAIDYIAESDKFSLTTNPGHDVISYVNHINNWNGRQVITTSNLRSKNIVNLINPFIWLGLYSVGNYVDSGDRDWELPCIDIAGAKYLPSMSLYLAPWGPEYHLNNYIKDTNGKTYKVTLRYGKTGDKTGAGLGITANKLYSSMKFSIDGNAELWRQPEIDTSTAAASKEKMGWMLSAKLNYAITKDFHANIQAGYKKAGFIPGESLSAGPVIKAGVFFRI